MTSTYEKMMPEFNPGDIAIIKICSDLNWRATSTGKPSGYVVLTREQGLELLKWINHEVDWNIPRLLRPLHSLKEHISNTLGTQLPSDGQSSAPDSTSTP